MAMPEGMITVAEAARRLGRSIEQVRRYLREGKLPGQRIGQQWFIPEASLELRYQPARGRFQRVKEPTAVMEATKREEEGLHAVEGERLIGEDLIAEIDRLREEIRRQHGTFDVVALVRKSRQEH